jgi:PAS domain S-box-containing protein
MRPRKRLPERTLPTTGDGHPSSSRGQSLQSLAGNGPLLHPAESASILLVDDSQANLIALDATLEPLGYPRVQAHSGEEALKQLLERRFAVILLDVQMPGLDGFETARMIRDHPRSSHTPIIFISAIHRDHSQVMRGYSHGAVDYLLKPFEPEVLRSKVSVLLELHIQNAKIQHQAELLRQRERSTLEEKLEQRLRSLTDLMPLCLWVAQPDGKVYYTNQVWQSYSGLTPAQSTDLGLTSVHPEDRERVRLGWRNAVQQGAHFEMEYRLRRRSDGLYRWHLGRAMPERDEQKRILSWIITATDIDDLKRVQQERSELLELERKARREAEIANRTKDEFLASVSHELRTPLNAILGWARMLRSGMIEAPKVARALEIVERNAQVQKELIEDILDVSRIITGKLRLQTRRISWPAIVRAALDTVRPAAEAKQIQLEALFENEELEAAGDPDRLQQVVWNLLSNAIKFTPSGGEVWVELRLVGGEVEVQVHDNGRGITADFLPHVFNSFRQADNVSTRTQGGLGLGLAIVRHLVELHGGTVVAESSGEGSGATFTVRLPRRKIREDFPEPSWLIPENLANGKPLDIRLDGVQVLFVDDQPDARELVKELLELHGASVTVAETADEALQTLRQRKIHVLLSDIGLPLVDGYELIRKVRELPAERGGRVPAVAVTGFARAEDSQRALSEGFQNHLSKPIEPMELVQLVATLSAGIA